MQDQRVYCPVCAEVVGVYEPAVVVDQAQTRQPSLAQEPSLRTGEQIVMHRDCALTREPARPN